jgi:hypothetical protein
MSAPCTSVERLPTPEEYGRVIAAVGFRPRRPVRSNTRASSARSTRAPFIQQGLIVARADERPAHDGHDVRAIAVRGHRHPRGRP